MLRNAEFLNVRTNHDYKIEPIEQFLDKVAEQRYEWAINYLKTIEEDSKTLDLNDYDPNHLERDLNLLKSRREKLDHEIYHQSHENFENKYRKEFDENLKFIMSFEDYSWCGFIGEERYLKRLLDDERVSIQAEKLLQIHKQRAKDDKKIRLSFDNELKQLKHDREAWKIRKSYIKLQREHFKEFTDKHGKEWVKFDLKEVAKGNLEEQAQNYSKIEREFLRNDIYGRTEEYVGKLVSMENIKWGNNGSLNGVVIGEKGDKARVETIIAGGYNIQCAHYRVLVKPLK